MATLANLGLSKWKGTDENGVPRLHSDPNRHFERVLVFLAYRNVFAQEEMAIKDKEGLRKAKKRVMARLKPIIESREHLTPATSPIRITQVLTALFLNGEFQSTSAVRAAFSGISDEQLSAHDPSISHRVTSYLHPLVDGQFLDPVRGAKERNKERRAQAAADRTIKQHMKCLITGQNPVSTTSEAENDTFLTKGRAKAARRAARAAQTALDRPEMLQKKLEAHIAELELEVGLFRVTSPVNGMTAGQPRLQDPPIVVKGYEMDVETIRKWLTEARDAALQTSLRRLKCISQPDSSRLQLRASQSANSERSLLTKTPHPRDKMGSLVDLSLGEEHTPKCCSLRRAKGYISFEKVSSERPNPFPVQEPLQSISTRLRSSKASTQTSAAIPQIRKQKPKANAPAAVVTSRDQTLLDVPQYSQLLQFRGDGHRWMTHHVDKSELPFRLQHNLLVMVQKVLEEALFFFTQKWASSLLAKLEWYTPEQGELSLWGRALMNSTVPGEAVDFGSVDTARLFQRIAQLRHAAVHRQSTPNAIIGEEMFPDALLITSGVRDATRHSKLLDIQKAFEACRSSTPNFRFLEEVLGLEHTVHTASNIRRSIRLKRHATAAAGLPVKRARLEIPHHNVIDLTQDSDDDGRDDGL